MTLSLYYYGDTLSTFGQTFKTYSVRQIQNTTKQYISSRYPVPYALTEKIGLRFSHELLYNQTKNASRRLPNEWIQELEPKIEEYLANSTENLWIVVWEPPFGNRGMGPGVGGPACGKCTVTYDRSMITPGNPGAVIFHFNELRPDNFPGTRYPNQLYTFWTMEGPRALKQLRGMTLQEYDEVFNLTMTYRRDSDVTTAYGYDVDTLSALKVSPEDFDDKMQEILSTKTGLALWIVSNCGGAAMPAGAERIRVSQSLVDAGLYIERKGACFDGRDDSFKPFDYKFYLSFENQLHCRDYITEKLWNNAYRNNAVPIVWGATKADYEAVAPPNSFIFAEDYTPKELAKYINYLNSNDTAYAEYFKWRTLNPEQLHSYGWQKSFCQLCRILHGINVDNIYNPDYEKKYKDIPLFGYPDQPRVIPSLSGYLYGTENEECIK